MNKYNHYIFLTTTNLSYAITAIETAIKYKLSCKTGKEIKLENLNDLITNHSHIVRHLLTV